MSTLSRWRTELRQRRHHREFRIPRAEDDVLLAELDRLLAQPATDLDEKALAEAATNLWRAQRKLAQDVAGASRYTRPAGLYLGLSRDSLKGIGLVVQDHDGDAYHPGQRLEVVSFEDDAEADAERVLRTVRPSVYFQDKHIQIGQVVVGCPVSEGDSHA